MAKTFIRKSLIMICLGLLLCQPVYAKDVGQKQEVKVEETQEIQETQETQEIQDEEVPLGLSRASFEKYKRDVVVLVVFGGLLVSITVIALVKEKYEREKYN